MKVYVLQSTGNIKMKNVPEPAPKEGAGLPKKKLG